ncbi:hypothetical protein [Sphingomonas sp. 28-63-12]|uniref:hypothetical protein n=1 Tax=Sphingomonas sp. 28-63-12 TaxID=1970434 RepID=UPI000BD28AB7|nr:MAG: hypothetical protein B7Y47_11910 [Sphingomonas sp. 28-63-12]
MSDLPDEQVSGAARTDWLLLEYDYFKHLSTIGLVTLGAMLTWVQGDRGAGTTLVMVSLALVSMGTVLGFGAMNTIISHRKTGKPLRRFFNYERGISSGLFATGLGIFLSEIGKVVN